MKKYKILFLTLTLILSLMLGVVACGGDSGTGDGGGDTPPAGPVITNVEGTKGLAYEVEIPKKGSPYAVCTGIGTATDTDIVIGSHFEGYVVEQVEANAFRNNTQIKSVTFVNGMKKINMYAFEGCTELFSVIISETIESIGQNAFRKCEYLLNVCNDSAIDIKMGSTKYGYVGNYACNIYSSKSGAKGEFKTEGDYECFDAPGNKFILKYNGNETALEIPSNATGIGKDAFKGNQTLKEVFIPSSVQIIGKMAFSDCSSLEKVTISENTNLKEIGESAFANCEALKEYNFNSSLNEYLKIKFVSDTSNPSYYTKDIKIQGNSPYEISFPNGLKEINAYAFVKYEGLTSLIIPTSVEVIGTGAFFNCIYLKTILFEDIDNSNLKTILDGAFDGCITLDGIRLPKSLEVIEVAAFRDCKGMRSVIIENDSKLTDIKDRAFNNCESLLSVHLGHNSSLKNVGSYAFTFCKTMTSFNFGNNSKVEVLNSYSFQYCQQLKELYLPKTLTTMGGYVFSGCFYGPRNDPNTPYLKIYTELDSKPAGWSNQFNSSNCPVFYNTPYPKF